MEKMQQNNTEWQIAGRYLISLLRCALHGQLPESKVSECSWHKVWILARNNNVECTVSPIICKLHGDIPEDIQQAWSAAQNQNLYRLLRFEMEREQIMEEMARHGIAGLPLKGILMADYYPQPGMRWMCDNDILYGYICKDQEGKYKPKGECQREQEYWKRQAQTDLCTVMKELGYTAEYLKGSHDVYCKKPFFNFEMHHRLVSEDSEFAEYYSNPWKRAVEFEKLKFRFSDEDEYLYFVAHTYKHFDGSGCGIRTLVDEYVILQKKDHLDWKYIGIELKYMKLAEFEDRLRNTALRAFGIESQLQQEDWQMIYYMLGCGTYGTAANRVKRKLRKLDGTDEGEIRRKYFLERFCLDERKMKEFFPFFYKHKAFRILLPLFRLGRGMIIHPGRLIEEWRAVRKYTKDWSKRQYGKD